MKRLSTRLLLLVVVVFAMTTIGVLNLSASVTDNGIEYYILDGRATITNYSGSEHVLDIPSSINGAPVVEIGNFAFEDCKSLTSVTIPEGVISISNYAFSGCENLENISVPNSVLKISETAFDFTAYSSNEKNWEDDVLYIGSALICARSTVNGTYEIKNGTTVIADSAFNRCKELKSVIIPNGIKSIGANVFNGCELLKDIIIPKSVVSVDCSAFYNTAYYDTPKNWEDDVLYIDSVLIKAKSTLNGSYEIKNGTTLVSRMAFYGCKELESIKMPDSVIDFGDYAFYGCSNLSNIKISETATNISSSMFSGCKSLTNVTVPHSVISIGNEAFRECENLKSICLSNELTRIGRYAFDNCESLTNIVLPEKCNVIGIGAFYKCSSLTGFVIPKGVKCIGEGTFYSCLGLESVSIPDSVIVVGENAFYRCVNLKDVYYGGDAEEWNKIQIENSNECLTDADIHFVIESTSVSEDTLTPPTEPSTGGEDNTTDPTEPSTGGEDNPTDSTEPSTGGEDNPTDSTDPTNPVVLGLLGDANEDGKVNIKDATLIQKSIANLTTLTETGEVLADADLNTKINIKDATAIQKHIAGIETGYPIGKSKTK